MKKRRYFRGEFALCCGFTVLIGCLGGFRPPTTAFLLHSCQIWLGRVRFRISSFWNTLALLVEGRVISREPSANSHRPPHPIEVPSTWVAPACLCLTFWGTNNNKRFQHATTPPGSHIHTFTHSHIHTFTHSHTYTHKHTFTQGLLGLLGLKFWSKEGSGSWSWPSAQVGFQVRRPCVFAKPIPIDEMRVRENQSAAFSHTNASSRARIKAATNKSRPHKRKRQAVHHDIFPHTQHIHNAHTCIQYSTTPPGSKCTPNTHACPYDIRFIVNMII